MVTEFQSKVYAVCKQIPKGKVSSYKDIAHALNMKGYRAIGLAMNKNPFAPEVPCHRVVSSDGSLGGFAHGPEKKIAMLKKEGIEVIDGKIIEFEKKLFTSFLTEE